MYGAAASIHADPDGCVFFSPLAAPACSSSMPHSRICLSAASASCASLSSALSSTPSIALLRMARLIALDRESRFEHSDEHPRSSVSTIFKRCFRMPICPSSRGAAHAVAISSSSRNLSTDESAVPAGPAPSRASVSRSKYMLIHSSSVVLTIQPRRHEARAAGIVRWSRFVMKKQSTSLPIQCMPIQEGSEDAREERAGHRAFIFSRAVLTCIHITT
jgi:hypothetical protein